MNPYLNFDRFPSSQPTTEKKVCFDCGEDEHFLYFSRYDAEYRCEECRDKHQKKITSGEKE